MTSYFTNYNKEYDYYKDKIVIRKENIDEEVERFAADYLGVMEINTEIRNELEKYKFSLKMKMSNINKLAEKLAEKELEGKRIIKKHIEDRVLKDTEYIEHTENIERFERFSRTFNNLVEAYAKKSTMLRILGELYVSNHFSIHRVSDKQQLDSRVEERKNRRRLNAHE